MYSTVSNKSIPDAKLEANLHLKKALFLLFLSFLHYACTAVRAPVLSPTPPPPPPPTHKKELKMRRIHVFARMWQRELGEEEDGIVEIGYSKRERGKDGQKRFFVRLHRHRRVGGRAAAGGRFNLCYVNLLVLLLHKRVVLSRDNSAINETRISSCLLFLFYFILFYCSRGRL